MGKQRRAPRNTAKEVQEHPLAFVAEAVASGGGGAAILHQEAAGQRSFVGSDTLPTDLGRYSGGYNTRTILEAAGVKFLGPVAGDRLFQYVELPPGWKKVATDHSMWSKLVDDKGRERATIFYKAAFYDRSASLSLSRRFNVSFDFDRFDRDGVGVSEVTDGGTVIHTTDPIPANGDQRFKVSERSDKTAVAWLDEQYPDWRNPGAYWE